MYKVIIKLAGIVILSGLGPAGGVSFAAEFEVLDRFSVDGYTVLSGSADIPGGSFTVGVSTFVVKGGNVGIGTTAPGYKLDIQTSTDNDGIEITNNNGAAEKALRLTYDFTNNYAKIEAIQAGTGYKSILLNPSGGDNYGWVGIGTTNPQGKLDVYGKMVVKSDGKVGIGTTSPGYKLDVNGTTGLNGSLSMLDNAIYLSAGGDLLAGISGSGAVNLHARGPLTLDYNANDIGTAFTITNKGSAVLAMDPAGKVGIGTIAPSANLQVTATTPVIKIGSTVDGNGALIGELRFADLVGNAAESYYTQLAGIRAYQKYYGSNQNAGELTFYTSTSNDAAERLRITNSGNVGIGTTGPNLYGGTGTVLTVAGNAAGEGGHIELANTAADAENNTAVMDFSVSGNTVNKRVGALVWRTEGAAANARGSRLEFYTAPNSGSIAERMRIDSAGNVGIGTPAPAGHFSVGSDGVVGSYRTYTPGANTGSIVIDGYDFNNGANYDWVGNIISMPETWTGNGNGSLLRFLTANSSSVSPTEKMRIDKNGNVGIGTTNPAAKLEVAGSIMSINNPKYTGGGITASWQTVCTLSSNGYNFVSGMLFMGGNENMRNMNIQAYLVVFGPNDGWRMSSQQHVFTYSSDYGNYSWQLLTDGQLQAKSTTPYGGSYWVDISKLVYH